MLFRTCTAFFFIVALVIAGCGPSAKQQAQGQKEPANSKSAKDTPFYRSFDDAEKVIASGDQEGLTKAVESLKEQGDGATKQLVEIARNPSGSKSDRLAALVVLGEMNQPTNAVLEMLREVSEQEEDAALKSTAYEVFAKLSATIATGSPLSQGTQP